LLSTLTIVPAALFTKRSLAFTVGANVASFVPTASFAAKILQADLTKETVIVSTTTKVTETTLCAELILRTIGIVATSLSDALIFYAGQTLSALIVARATRCTKTSVGTKLRLTTVLIFRTGRALTDIVFTTNRAVRAVIVVSTPRDTFTSILSLRELADRTLRTALIAATSKRTGPLETDLTLTTVLVLRAAARLRTIARLKVT
jgi:hypothetical protein